MHIVLFLFYKVLTDTTVFTQFLTTGSVVTRRMKAKPIYIVTWKARKLSAEGLLCQPGVSYC